MEAFLSGRGAEVEGLSLEGQQGMGADQMVLHSEVRRGGGGGGGSTVHLDAQEKFP